MASARLSNNKKKMITSLVKQANQAQASERYDVMAMLCTRIEAIQPDNPDAYNMRAVLCLQEGNLEKAEELFLSAIEGAPKRGLFHANLAALLMIQGHYIDAVRCYEKAMELDPNVPTTEYGYGSALLEAGYPEDACPVLEKSRKRNPRDLELLETLCRTYYELDRINEARDCLDDMLKIDPVHAWARAQSAAMDFEAGRLEEGEAALQEYLKINPHDVQTRAGLAAVKKYTARDDSEVKAIDELYARSDPDSEDRQKLAFALGRIMHDLGDYDAAFAYFKEGNEIALRKNPYNNRREVPLLQSFIKTFTPEILSRTSGLDDATPIFIVGMPRCGSTLTEQILAAHPDVGSKGEWGFFNRKLLRDYHSRQQPLSPERVAAFTPEQWRALGEVYLEKLKADHPDALRITDKSLRNISLVGAIHCALPKAKIVHVRRHPLDTCLSIYRTSLRGAVFDYGRDLGELGLFYRMYLKLMQHWRDVLPAGVMYELDYEDLTANQEEETRKLLDACGLDWDERCLQFNQVNNRVRTASVTQVRRAMYRDSVAAWQRYEEHLQPLIRILGTDRLHPRL